MSREGYCDKCNLVIGIDDPALCDCGARRLKDRLAELEAENERLKQRQDAAEGLLPDDHVPHVRADAYPGTPAEVAEVVECLKVSQAYMIACGLDEKEHSADDFRRFDEALSALTNGGEA